MTFREALIQRLERRSQERELEWQRQIIEHQRVILELNRAYRELIVNFRRALDEDIPDLDLRLEQMLVEMDDHVARLEEFAS